MRVEKLVRENYLYYDVCISFHFCIKAFCKQLITYKSLLVFAVYVRGLLSHTHTHPTTTPTASIYIDMWIGKMIQFSISDDSCKIGSIFNLWILEAHTDAHHTTVCCCCYTRANVFETETQNCLVIYPSSCVQWMRTILNRMAILFWKPIISTRCAVSCDAGENMKVIEWKWREKRRWSSPI